MLEIRGVDKVYKTAGLSRKVLKNIRLNFRTSEFVAILGPSGSGKTTLLNIVGGLDNYTSGDLTINEKSTKKFRDKDWDAYRNHRIGFVFQSYNLIPHQTVLANVRLALTLSGISKRESIRRAKKALKDVGLEEHINKLPNQLSGGQMQRVAIARALVNDPDILLADEPTGALDSETSVQIMKLLKEVAKNKLVIMVTHNPDLANEYATRIITIKDGKVTGDTNPYDGKQKTNLDTAEAGKKTKKTRMSFITALSLSLKNLLTKKARTILVAAAGSIGIIGIALISAVSTGFQNYIDSIERDTLTSYPLNLLRESTDVTGLLLSMTGENPTAAEDGIVKENQVITSMLGSVTTNDLKSFREYLSRHQEEVKNDVRLIVNSYSVDPLVYTKDATKKIAKLNPSNLFTSMVGENSILSSYSTFSSVYNQYPKETLENDMDLVAGRLPENYNELVILLNDKNSIPDLLTYSLGLHDTKELSEVVSKMMSGEKTTINHEPLKLTYDDLMNVDLRLIYPADIYKYNEKYNVYEDMSSDEVYMNSVYQDKAEKLKIVGIVTAKSEMMSAGSGVIYLPSLPEHIIKKSAETEIVKKQLASPDIDIFSNRKFGEKTNDFNFEFSDLVSVDNAALSRALNVTIDQNAISAKTKEYMSTISDDISSNLKNLPVIQGELTAKFKSLAEGLTNELSAKISSGEINIADLISDPAKAEQIILSLVDDFTNSQDFSELESKYIVPAAQFNTFYNGLLKAYLASYLQKMLAGQPFSMDDFLKTTEINTAFETLSTSITEIFLQQGILTKVGGLTAYLSSSFADAFNIDENALLSAFKLNFTEDELARVVSAMFTKKESTLSSNLALLGYQNLDEPTRVSFYFTSFDGKNNFINFLERYNDLMKSYDNQDKVIEYNDTTGILMSSVKTIVDAVSYVLIAFVSISLIVSSIMIGVITYISVYERTKEIGILRAIGASKHNISNIFNAETFIIGFLSGLIGVGISYALIPIINLILHHFTGDIPLSAALNPHIAGFLIVLSIILTLIGGLIPARAASKKDPVEALRTE